MNIFVSIIVIVLGILFLIFFCYELYALVRDIKKHAKKKKDNQPKDTPNNDSK